MCTGVGAANCVVAQSQGEFSDTQGIAGWYYGAWVIDGDDDGRYEPSELEPFAYVDGVWRPTTWAPEPDPNFTWAYLAVDGGHPGSYPIRRAPVRRWVSTVSGRAYARVTHAKSDPNGGDGTRAMLVVDGELLLQRDVAFDDTAGFVEDVPITLHVGSTVDLLLHYIGDDAVDTTTQILDIVSR